MKKIKLFIFLSVLFSCNSKIHTLQNKYYLSIFKNGTATSKSFIDFENKHYAKISNKYLSKPLDIYFLFDSIDKKNLREINTYFMDRKYGHCLKFYDNGNLESYSYVVNSDSSNDFYRYGRKYGTDGKLVNEEGSPYVDCIRNKDENSAILFFSTVFYDSISAQISFDGNQYKDLALKRSNFQPFLLESEIEVPVPNAFLILNCKNEKHSNTIPENKIYNDTAVVK